MQEYIDQLIKVYNTLLCSIALTLFILVIPFSLYSLAGRIYVV